MSEKRYIDIDNCIYGVKKMKKDKGFKLGYAYIYKDKYVLPFRGTYIPDSKNPGIYIHNDEIIILKPLSKKKVAHYSISRTYSIDTIGSINKIIINEGVRSEELDNILGETDEIFAPPLSDNDNALQILIKKALIKKQIDLNNYVNRFKSPSDLNNHKRSLLHHGKMSYEKFFKWCEVLDLKFEIIIDDLSYSSQPMGDKVKFKSEQ